MLERSIDSTHERLKDRAHEAKPDALGLLTEGRNHFLNHHHVAPTHHLLPELKIDGSERKDRTSPQIANRERELEQKFPGIQFVAPGASLGNKVDGTTDREVANQPIRARAPRMAELNALDKALANSHQAYRDPEGKPLQIGFTNDGAIAGTDSRQGPGAAYEERSPAHPNNALLRIFPAGSSMPSLQVDLPQNRRSEISSPQSLEAVLNHELGHATQDHTGGLEPSADAAYKREAGWVPLHNPPSDKPNDWALTGKDGYLYKMSGAFGHERWLRLEGGAGYDANGNYAGHFLDPSGKRVGDTAHPDPSKALGLDTQSMRLAAKVTPLGLYFPNPQEETAEALRAYRTSPLTRHALQTQNPALYRVAEHLDRLNR